MNELQLVECCVHTLTLHINTYTHLHKLYWCTASAITLHTPALGERIGPVDDTPLSTGHLRTVGHVSRRTI